MKITRISPTRNGKRFNIYLDYQYSFTVGPNTIAKYLLFEGKNLEDIEVIKNYDFEDRFFLRIIDLVSRRPRSKKEIYDYLKRKIGKRYKSNFADKLISKLEKKKYINDYDFAFWWIENRLSFKPRSKNLLILELKKKGIDKDIIDEVLNNSKITKEQELEFAEILLAKKLHYRKLNSDNKKKYVSFLARKGFSFDIINKIIKKYQ